MKYYLRPLTAKTYFDRDVLFLLFEEYQTIRLKVFFWCLPKGEVRACRSASSRLPRPHALPRRPAVACQGSPYTTRRYIKCSARCRRHCSQNTLKLNSQSQLQMLQIAVITAPHYIERTESPLYDKIVLSTDTIGGEYKEVHETVSGGRKREQLATTFYYQDIHL